MANKNDNSLSAHWLSFHADTEGYDLPQKFTFPFHYTPHPLARLAAAELQTYVLNERDWEHDFGLDTEGGGLGKMFGVLVVQNTAGELGYLAAFSGKLTQGTQVESFVPPVFDTLSPDGFYRKGEERLLTMNHQIRILENDPNYLTQQKNLADAENQLAAAISAQKQAIKTAKQARAERRAFAKHTLSAAEYAALDAQLNQESADGHYQLKDLMRKGRRHIEALQAGLATTAETLKSLKEQRRQGSNALQRQLFESYSFLNAEGTTKHLLDIFNDEKIPPPSGAGECAAPKLLHFAYQNGLKPIALAEFWWGLSPASEIRQHGQFYPACKSKCEPILSHMLVGLKVDDNPAFTNPAEGRSFDILFEDDCLIILNKPAEFLSVSGKKITDSIQTRIRALRPDATGPLIVHRLDMSTSGLMVVAKTREAYVHLQSQFAKRKVKKTYVALLEGEVEGNLGEISLPLRVDLDNRPRQLVCYQYGKRAKTLWQVIERQNGRTRIEFQPITGRTHQLRVHAAHPQGLYAPIVGDDLYGTKGTRLCLHAQKLGFEHPLSKKWVEWSVTADF
jgi:tRNA pseudouridine32 synthase / 23S rRNA pseudouridine746 synthase